MSNSGHPPDTHSKRIRKPNSRFKEAEDPLPKKPKTEKPKIVAVIPSVVIPAIQLRKNCKIITKLFTNTNDSNGIPILADSDPMDIDEYIGTIREDIVGQLSKNNDEYRMLIQNANKVPSGHRTSTYTKIPYALILVPSSRIHDDYKLPDELRDKIIDLIASEIAIKLSQDITDKIKKDKKSIKEKYALFAIDTSSELRVNYKDVFNLKTYDNAIKSFTDTFGVINVVRAECTEGGGGGSKNCKSKSKGRTGKSKSKSKSKSRNGKSKSRNGKSKSKKLNIRY